MCSHHLVLGAHRHLAHLNFLFPLLFLSLLSAAEGEIAQLVISFTDENFPSICTFKSSNHSFQLEAIFLTEDLLSSEILLRKVN